MKQISYNTLKSGNLLIIIFGLISCEQSLDSSVGQDYAEIKMCQQWYYDYLQTNFAHIRSNIYDRGELTADKEVEQSLTELLREYQILKSQLEDSQKLIYENFTEEQLLRVEINDSLQTQVVSGINNWLAKSEVDSRLSVANSQTEGLLLDLNFNLLALDILKDRIVQAYQHLYFIQLVYLDEDTFKLAGADTYFFDEILANNKPVQVDSLGQFKLGEERPLAIEWRKSLNDGVKLRNLKYQLR